MMYWIVGTVFLFMLIFYLYFGNYAMFIFYKCMKLDVRISYWELACMKYRGVPINDLLLNAIRLKEYGISVKIKDLELHMKSGGRVYNVVNILINAKKKKIDLSYHQAAIMDMDEINKQKKSSPDNKDNSSEPTQEQSSEPVAEQPSEQPSKESSESVAEQPSEQVSKESSEQVAEHSKEPETSAQSEKAS